MNSGKLKILHLTSVFEVGGQQRLISDLVRYDSSFNVHYLAILRRSTEALAFFEKEIQVLFYEGLSDNEIIARLKNFVAEEIIKLLKPINSILRLLILLSSFTSKIQYWAIPP